MKLPALFKLGKKLKWPLNAYSIEELKKGDDGRTYRKLKRQYKYIAQMQQDELERAILAAEDPERRNRLMLYGIYKKVARDRHLYGNIRTLIFKITGSPFAVFHKGAQTIDEVATNMLQTAWFEEYRWHFHWTPWYGHSLVEFQEMIPSEKEGLEAEFKKIKVIPREHVMPEYGLITLYPQDETRGVPFREAPFNKWLMEIGKEEDLGLLHMAAEEVIWKRYGRVDWSRHSEKYGMPLLSIKTSTQQESELDKLEEMASNIGANGYVIVDDEDEVNIVESNRSGESYKMYYEKVKLCNEELSKLISGQTLTSGADGKGSYALGDVHADVLSEYQEAGMRSETYHINDDLFPFLIRHGYPLKDREFRYLAFMNEEGEGNQGEQEPDGPAKRKPNLPGGRFVNFTEPRRLPSGRGWLTYNINRLYFGHDCKHDHAPQAASIVDLEGAVEKALRKVFDKKLKAGQADRDLFLAQARELMRGIKEGYGQKVDSLVYGSTRHQMFLQLQYNTHVFAAFKNHHNINELVNALVDQNGQLRTFAQFKKAAGSIDARYNKNWIRAEYQQAVQSSQNALLWQRYQDSPIANLKYVAVLDGGTTQICRELDGAIYPKGHPFWNTHAPGNHWGCRSKLRLTLDNPNYKAVAENVPPAFRDNPGKSGKPFADGHPYLTVQAQYARAAERMFGMPMPVSTEKVRANIRAWELLDKKEYSQVITYNQSSGFVAVHKRHGKGELKSNLGVAKELAEKKGERVILLEKIERHAVKSPDALINDQVFELKVTREATYNVIDSALRSAKKQSGNIAIKVSDAMDIEILEKAIYDRVRRSNIQQLIVELDGEFYYFNREEIINQTFKGKMTKK